MPKASLHMNIVGGYAGANHLTRCYKLDTPKKYDRIDHYYVTVTITVPQKHMDGEVTLHAATETGMPSGSLKRRAGSFVLHEAPVTPEYVEGCFKMALALAGYELDV